MEKADRISANIPLSAKYAQLNLDPLSLSIKAAQEKRISESREFFEQLINDYSTCGRFWKIYIEQELKYRNFELVEKPAYNFHAKFKLFQRCIIKVLNVDLWKCYLNYVRDIKSKMPTYREKIAQAYDFALDKIGLDVNSYSIWVDYINFLKSVEVAGSFAENQKITAIRKVYQKGVMNPMMNVEQLWKDYCAFENQINPLIAKRMIDDRSREFMMVRKISKEYENVTRNLDRNSPCFPPQGTPEEIKQKAHWKKYIEWEKSNPLKSEDIAQVAKRVMFAYEQCLLYLATHPDIYYEATSYLQQMSILMAEKCDAVMGRHYANEAVNLYERAISTFMKHNMLIYFAYCDFEESRLNYTKVNEIYEKILKIEEIDPSLCYIQYMRFKRRVEGIPSARAIFKRAREDKRISYHVYVAAAFMEYLCTKDKYIAYKIFQLGLKIFGNIPEYILAFIDFLMHMNDNQLIRSMFNLVLDNPDLPKDKIRNIWSEWLNFENNVGNLEDLEYIEKKRKQIYGEHLNERNLAFLVDRFKFMNLYPCSENEMKLLGFNDSSDADVYNELGTNAALKNVSLAANVTTIDKENEADELNSSKNVEIANSINPFVSSSIKRAKYPVPDMKKMLPFKPIQNAFIDLQPVPGGGMFLFPSIFAEMIKRLPPPNYFDGPYVIIDEFLNNFNRFNLPDDFQTFFKHYQSNLENKTLSSQMSKRASTSLKDGESNQMDIYKQRQQKKMTKT